MYFYLDKILNDRLLLALLLKSSAVSHFVEEKISHRPNQFNHFKFTSKLPGCCTLLHCDKCSLLADWLGRLKPTALHTADVLMWTERQTGRDGERGRQKDVASASRLSSNWFVVFSEHVWVWLMCSVRPWSRQKTFKLTDLFLFYCSLQIFVGSLNFALVHSHMELCQSTSVYVEEQFYAAWVYYCIRQSRHHPCSLLGPRRSFREWQERGDSLVFIFSSLNQEL